LVISDKAVSRDEEAAHQHSLVRDLDVAQPPTDTPWGVREMHLRHPDGHVSQISQQL